MNEIAIIISVFSLLVSIAGAVIAVKSWHKSRAYYDIESTFLRGDTINQLKKQLSTGKYTIISTFQDEARNIRILLGKIKE
jgi:hypothetical protein